VHETTPEMSAHVTTVCIVAVHFLRYTNVN